MIRPINYTTALICLAILHTNCSNRIMNNKSLNLDLASDTLKGARVSHLESSEDQFIKYIVYESSSNEINAEGAEDIREIAVYKDLNVGARVIIHTSSSPDAEKKARDIKSLMTHFGITESALYIVTEDDPTTHICDNVVMLKIEKEEVNELKDIATSND